MGVHSTSLLCIAVVAGGSAAVITTPSELVKIRLQHRMTPGSHLQLIVGARCYLLMRMYLCAEVQRTGTLQYAVTLWRSQGLGALYKGLCFRVMCNANISVFRSCGTQGMRLRR